MVYSMVFPPFRKSTQHNDPQNRYVMFRINMTDSVAVSEIKLPAKGVPSVKQTVLGFITTTPYRHFVWH